MGRSFRPLLILTGLRSRVLRLCLLLHDSLSSSMMLLLLYHLDLVDLVLHLARVLPLDHHLLIQEELWVAHEASSYFVVVRVLHQDGIEIVLLVCLGGATLLIVKVGGRHLAAVLHRNTTSEPARCELLICISTSERGQCLLVLAVAVEEALALL